MKWVEALKKYNEGKKWTVPKKGTPEYMEVMKIMGKDAAVTEVKAAEKSVKIEEKIPVPVPEKKVRKSKPKAEEPVVEAVEKPVKKRAKKSDAVVAPDVSSNAADAKPEAPRKRKAKAGSVPAGMIPEGITKKAVAASANPEAVLQSATNAHMPVVPAEAMVGLKGIKATKKHLREVEQPKLPELVDKERAVDAAPFSFQALRNHLGC